MAHSPATADIMLCTGDAGDRTLFERLAGNEAWRIHHVKDFADAARLLGKWLFRAVVCDADLGGGMWRDLLRVASHGAVPPRVIVLSRQADVRLWAEALNLGAYDLLMKPLDFMEARRVLTLATSGSG
jgi:DNA-binding NtrC family response regulator